MRKLLALIGIVAAFVVGAPTSSSAGCCVVVSVDEIPAVHAGEEVEIGFTVLLQGGAATATGLGYDDLVVALVSSGGTSRQFEAVQQGAAGHHVATIEVPDEGAYQWSVGDSSGDVVLAELGTLTVIDPPAGASWRWDALQWGSATFAVAMAGLAAFDLRRSKRGRAAPATA